MNLPYTKGVRGKAMNLAISVTREAKISISTEIEDEICVRNRKQVRVIQREINRFYFSRIYSALPVHSNEKPGSV
jgi:hypothetical protein